MGSSEYAGTTESQSTQSSTLSNIHYLGQRSSSQNLLAARGLLNLTYHKSISTGDHSTNLPIRLAADISSCGIGAVLSHVMDDGSECPIAFVSRTHSPSERLFSDGERSPSTIYGVRKFHHYIYGRNSPWLLTISHSWLSWNPRVEFLP